MAATKAPENIAIVGATGHIGKFLAEGILATSKHTVTALTRAESKGTLPEGVIKVQVDYDDHESLINALRGQDFLIICLAVQAPPDTQSKIFKAAAEAGVHYVMPSFFGSDIRDSKLSSQRLGSIIQKALVEMEDLGLSYISLACGVWYEWSLALGESWFGFQIPDKKVTFFDDGNTVLTVSTWLQCGRAVAALLSLPESGSSVSLSDWKNEPLYISSFRLSQRDMLDSLHRVLGTTDKDWEITYESTAKRYEDGLEEFSKGLITGMAKSMYAQHFISSKAGDIDNGQSVSNDVLGLPEESLDEATKRAVEMVESGWNPLA